mmetsp:Transcript_32251/g.96713  ORF Transcript_32251/g.96713 Transcript_32251/m.96713 type:complete len:237 (-) Transcript_32251:111-821(-)
MERGGSRDAVQRLVADVLRSFRGGRHAVRRHGIRTSDVDGDGDVVVGRRRRPLLPRGSHHTHRRRDSLQPERSTHMPLRRRAHTHGGPAGLRARRHRFRGGAETDRRRGGRPIPVRRRSRLSRAEYTVRHGQISRLRSVDPASVRGVSRRARGFEIVPPREPGGGGAGGDKRGDRQQSRRRRHQRIEEGRDGGVSRRRRQCHARTGRHFGILRGIAPEDGVLFHQRIVDVCRLRRR